MSHPDPDELSEAASTADHVSAPPSRSGRTHDLPDPDNDDEYDDLAERPSPPSDHHLDHPPRRGVLPPLATTLAPRPSIYAATSPADPSSAGPALSSPYYSTPHPFNAAAASRRASLPALYSHSATSYQPFASPQPYSSSIHWPHHSHGSHSSYPHQFSAAHDSSQTASATNFSPNPSSSSTYSNFHRSASPLSSNYEYSFGNNTSRSPPIRHLANLSGPPGMGALPRSLMDRESPAGSELYAPHHRPEYSSVSSNAVDIPGSISLPPSRPVKHEQDDTVAPSSVSPGKTTLPPPIKRRGKLPKPTTDLLKTWLHEHADHPYPSEDEKKSLCSMTGLTLNQVSNWMINARRRILAPAKSAAAATTTVSGPLTPPKSLTRDYPPLSAVAASYMPSGMVGNGMVPLPRPGLARTASGGMTLGHPFHTSHPSAYPPLSHFIGQQQPPGYPNSSHSHSLHPPANNPPSQIPTLPQLAVYSPSVSTNSEYPTTLPPNYNSPLNYSHGPVSSSHLGHSSRYTTTTASPLYMSIPPSARRPRSDPEAGLGGMFTPPIPTPSRASPDHPFAYAVSDLPEDSYQGSEAMINSSGAATVRGTPLSRSPSVVQSAGTAPSPVS